LSLAVPREKSDRFVCSRWIIATQSGYEGIHNV